MTYLNRLHICRSHVSWLFTQPLDRDTCSSFNMADKRAKLASRKTKQNARDLTLEDVLTVGGDKVCVISLLWFVRCDVLNLISLLHYQSVFWWPKFHVSLSGWLWNDEGCGYIGRFCFQWGGCVRKYKRKRGKRMVNKLTLFIYIFNKV